MIEPDDRLTRAIAAIDAANAGDPNCTEGRPDALLYGERMSAELGRLFPDADDVLRIAAHGQHIERWTSPRTDYPDGREGYLAWRRDLGAFHARRVGEIMETAGYDAAAIDRARRLLRKEGIKRDDQVQRLEDVICFVFLRWYFLPFAEDRDAGELQRIVARTARKMSPGGRARVLAEFALPEPLATAFRD
jgi:hypothetical protein